MVNRLLDRELGFGVNTDDLKESALVYVAAVRERLAEGCERVKQSIINQPVRAVGIALGMGVLLGWLTKRR
jgi:ElaB/YqjD/DUF883 family membrane-anchored ribosome-binding protein